MCDLEFPCETELLEVSYLVVHCMLRSFEKDAGRCNRDGVTKDRRQVEVKWQETRGQTD